ncbi:MAG: HAMP domain-containing sensor histidine kinase [Planctomycetaceae bacterium]
MGTNLIDTRESATPPSAGRGGAAGGPSPARGGWLPASFRKKRSLHWPITLSTLLITFNVVLMVCWIVLLAQVRSWGALTIGTIAFALILVGLIIYLAMTIKEVRVNQRQANFIDSVTHELKSPLASLKLYLETLQMRSLDDAQRARFYGVMQTELSRLDQLINHMLEVARLDAVGQHDEPENVDLSALLVSCAKTAAAHHRADFDRAFEYHLEPVTLRERRVVLEMIFRNLLDNAVKYAGSPPRVEVRLERRNGRVIVRVCDNGEGVPAELRRRIFRIFYRGGDELERRRTGTGLGLYIVRTLVHTLKGKVGVADREDGPGTVFTVELPEPNAP